MTDDTLIPVFIPKLGAVLLSAEDSKGSPLSLEEVIAIRDGATCIMMTPQAVAKFREKRGNDISPESCWYDFQMLRRDLGRQPDLDPGAQVNLVDSQDALFQQTIHDARKTLDTFRQSLPADGSGLRSAMIKTRIETDEQTCYVWLHVVRCDGANFVASFFEVPAGLTGIAIGDQRTIAENDVVDWAINDNGDLSGGYSLRYQRQQLPEDQRAEYDEYIGVTHYR